MLDLGCSKREYQLPGGSFFCLYQTNVVFLCEKHCRVKYMNSIHAKVIFAEFYT